MATNLAEKDVSLIVPCLPDRSPTLNIVSVSHSKRSIKANLASFWGRGIAGRSLSVSEWIEMASWSITSVVDVDVVQEGAA